MCDLVKKCGNSHVVIFLSSSLFGITQDPLWSLHNFSKRCVFWRLFVAWLISRRGPFENYVILEVREPGLNPMDVATLGALPLVIDPRSVLNALANGWLNSESFSVRSRCDLTIVPRNELPVTFRDANVFRNPWGRKISSVICPCGSVAGWENCEYEGGRLYRLTCSFCTQSLQIPRPIATRLLYSRSSTTRGEQSWAVAITQFAIDDCQWAES